MKYNIKRQNIKPYIYFNPKNNGLEDIKIMLENTFETVDEKYSQVMDYIIRLTSYTAFLCKGIDENYVINAFEDADLAIVIGDSTRVLPNGNIFGFALLNFNENNNSIYISIFCSHIGIYGAGEFLIKEIEKMCKILFITKIQLSSVEDAITFYKKYGFMQHDMNKRVCNMSKIL